ncbi:type I-G CRISPR-associated protein Csb2 [Candidatus Poriferisocius sp.]|uniref:type I-G CRISPR-associated protein Csb2 n=1 Tax=Candidatus Poriferisocius sp. TaxID=3101276 RepID=UPI003B5B1CF5
MLAVEVNFLTGRYFATAYNDRQAGEWPLHPARFFSSLAANWAEGGKDEAERSVLEWLEALPPPGIVASDAVPRRVVSFFVPVNDARIISGSVYEGRARKIEDLATTLEDQLEESLGELTRPIERTRDKFHEAQDVEDLVSAVGRMSERSSDAALRVLPEYRGKQERYFPSVTPSEARTILVWKNVTISKESHSILDNLVSRVTRIGHSSSLVSCRIVNGVSEPNYRAGSGTHTLRCTGPGQLVELEKRHLQHQGISPRALPFVAVRYSESTLDDGTGIPHVSADTKGDWIVFECVQGSRRLPSTRAVDIATTMRAAIMSHTEDPIPEGLSGHQSNGDPTRMPHVAFLPLPYVGFEHADGRVMGIAVSLPLALPDDSRQAVLRAMGHWEAETESDLTLRMGRGGHLQVRRCIGPIDLVTIRPGQWHKPARRWLSATPIALPTHPGLLNRGSVNARAKAWERAENAVVTSCRHVGLPEPTHVDLSFQSALRGGRPSSEFPTFEQRDRDGRPAPRRLLHAAITFDRPIAGPLMLGAGRFLGLGLMRPIGDVEEAAGTGESHE